MNAVHMSEAEIVRDPKTVLEKVQQGVEVIIERDNRPIAVISPPQPIRQTISDCIAFAEHHERERGYAVRLDSDFAADVEKIVQERQTWPRLHASLRVGTLESWRWISNCSEMSQTSSR